MHDTKLIGRYSGSERQIDILLEEETHKGLVRTVIDGKFYKRRVHVKDVEAFLGMLQDVGAESGILVTERGFSQAAMSRAYLGPENLELDILSGAELRQFQSGLAIPYAGKNGVLLLAPFGWVVDGQKNQFGPALLYQRGLTLEEALASGEFMYTQFWDRESDGSGLGELLKQQNEDLLAIYSLPADSIKYLEPIDRGKLRTALRRVEIRPGISEISGFVEFEKFIFFCVLLSKREFNQPGLRKLRGVIKHVLPLEVK